MITTPFGAQSTAADVIEGLDLTGKRAIVTGGSSGIGAETARVLAGAGAEVTLALGLHDALAAAGGARIVSVSSVGHIDGPVDFGDPNFEHRPYDQWAAYGQSKTANILFAVEAARRWGAAGITANALNPGRIPSTGLLRHVGAPPAAAPGIASSTGVSVKNIAQGAATSVLLAASPLVEGVSGGYFEDCQQAGPHQPGIRRGVASFAMDPGNAARLWDLSLDLIRG